MTNAVPKSFGSMAASVLTAAAIVFIAPTASTAEEDRGAAAQLLGSTTLGIQTDGSFTGGGGGGNIGVPMIVGPHSNTFSVGSPHMMLPGAPMAIVYVPMPVVVTYGATYASPAWPPASGQASQTIPQPVICTLTSKKDNSPEKTIAVIAQNQSECSDIGGLVSANPSAATPTGGSAASE